MTVDAELDAIRAAFGDEGQVAALARATDWSQHPLGPVPQWPALLRTTIRLAMSSPHPSRVWWGRDAIKFCNDAAVPTLRGKLSEMFARPVVLPEVGEIVARVFAGETVIDPRCRAQVLRDGKLEDAWFDIESRPIRDLDGTVVGVLHEWRGRTSDDQAALRESQSKLAIELTDALELQRISSILVKEDDIDVLYRHILDAACSLMRADKASIQILSPERNELFLLAQTGFPPERAKFWEWVQLEGVSSCSQALREGEQVIVPDLECWDRIAGTEDLEVYRLSGVRAVQSTPLIARDGRFVGIISTHWREVHRPSERE